MTSVDWVGLKKSSEGASVPDGDYDFRVLSAKAGQTGTKKPAIKCQFEILSGPLAGEKVPNTFTIEQSTAWKTFPQFAALGIEDTFLAQGPSLEQVADALVGRHGSMTVGHREWNGRTQVDIKEIRPLAGGVPSAPTAQVGFPPAAAQPTQSQPAYQPPPFAAAPAAGPQF